MLMLMLLIVLGFKRADIVGVAVVIDSVEVVDFDVDVVDAVKFQARVCCFC